MIIASGDIHARIPDREQVTALMRATQARVREEPGCLYYAFAETLDDPGHFVVVSHWQDQGALDAHYRSDAFAEYQAQVGAYLVRSSELRVFQASEALTMEPQPLEPQQDG
jgi:quinol monooxygenase YgiN